MKRLAMMTALLAALFAGCATTGEAPSSNKSELVFTEKWEEARTLVLSAFAVEGLSVTQNDVHDGWVFLLEGTDADGYKVNVTIFNGENSVEGEVTGEAPEGVMLWGDTPQTSFLKTLTKMSPGLQVKVPAPGQP